LVKASQGRILVIRGGAIGDFILTLPAIAALRRQFPEAHLEVLGYPHIVQLAIAGQLVDRASPIEAAALAGFFARNGELAENLVDYFSEFDLIISYLYDPDGIFRTNVGRCSPAQFIVGPHRPNERESLPAAQVFLRPLERLAIFDADPVPRLMIPGAAPQGSEAAVGQPSAQPLLALHPGSGSERKNWPEDRWAALLQLLASSSECGLLIVGGEAEGEKLQRLAAALPPLRTRVAQSLPLAQVAGLLAGCDGFVGHDSGISHLAGALGLKGLLLWGETNADIWRPPSPAMVLLSNQDGLSDLPVAAVASQMQQMWDIGLDMELPGRGKEI
jgi:heptosyltransferase-2